MEFEFPHEILCTREGSVSDFLKDSTKCKPHRSSRREDHLHVSARSCCRVRGILHVSSVSVKDRGGERAREGETKKDAGVEMTSTWGHMSL